MKGATEGKVRDALKSIDLRKMVYKPPDDARNWKPCDFMVFHGGGATFFEVKDLTAAYTFPVKELRPSQRQAILEAHHLDIPYWLVMWWRARKEWTISDAYSVLTYGTTLPPATVGIHRDLLASRFGVNAAPVQLASTLKQALVGELL